MRHGHRAAAALGLLMLPCCSQGFSAGVESDASVVARYSPGGAGAGGAAGNETTPFTRSPPPFDAGARGGAGGVATSEHDAGADVGSGGAAATHGGAGGGPQKSPCERFDAPAMVAVTTPAGTTFCIDETEITVGQYAVFLAADPGLELAPAGVCSWKKTFVPDGAWPLIGKDDYPISLVDWCDAAAYCAFAGKRLCGGADGAANPYADYAKPSDEWFYACSQGNKTSFPYGATFDPSACVGVDYDGISGFQPVTDAPRAAGSASRCHGASSPFSLVHDLAGNVAEWENSCNSSGGSADYCHVRGDSYRQGNESTMVCGSAPRMTRAYRAGYIGFRCCATP